MTPEEIQKQLFEDKRFWNELTPTEQEQIQFKFSKSIMSIIFEYPFFGFLAVKVCANPVWIKTPGQLAEMGSGWRTMATDGRNMYVWPQYVLYNPIEILIGTILHEIFHIVLLHVPRGKGYNRELANIAMDYVVNMMVNDFALQNLKGQSSFHQSRPMFSPDLYSKMPWYIPSPPYYHSEEFRQSNGDPMIWERVYDVLLKRQDPETQKRLGMGQSIEEATDGQGLSGTEGQMHDDHNIWQGNKPSSEEGDERRSDDITEQELKDMIRDAYVQANAGKNPGTLPGGLQKTIEEYLHPRMPWQRLVQNYLKPTDGWFGYQPGDIRFNDPVPWFIPDYKLRYILVTIDTSGSMNDQDVAKAIAETRNLLKGFPQTKGILCMCDYSVSYWEDINESYTLKHRRGYGGTSFQIPFEEVIKRKMKDQIDLHIYFTDGYGEYPTEEWLRKNQINFDTLWVITNSESQPPACRQYRFTRLGDK